MKDCECKVTEYGDFVFCRIHRAAPKLLEALEISTMALDVVVHEDPKNISAKCCIKRNREIIAKAEELEL